MLGLHVCGVSGHQEQRGARGAGILVCGGCTRLSHTVSIEDAARSVFVTQKLFQRAVERRRGDVARKHAAGV